MRKAKLKQPTFEKQPTAIESDRLRDTVDKVVEELMERSSVTGVRLSRKYCERCGEEICRERLEILPHATTCVKHSNAKPVAAEDLDMVTGADRVDMQRMMNGD